ncbi:MAG: hypothetical protein HRU19_30470 [Pseudobacteriovorax sp.]|nr:hypothetical protein [Pseudobacteriovorax sp.]
MNIGTIAKWVIGLAVGAFIGLFLLMYSVNLWVSKDDGIYANNEDTRLEKCFHPSRKITLIRYKTDKSYGDHKFVFDELKNADDGTVIRIAHVLKDLNGNVVWEKGEHYFGDLEKHHQIKVTHAYTVVNGVAGNRSVYKVRCLNCKTNKGLAIGGLDIRNFKPSKCLTSNRRLSESHRIQVRLG